MDGCGQGLAGAEILFGNRCILRSPKRGSSERKHEGSRDGGTRADSGRARAKSFFSCPRIHKKCTVHPQLFHRGPPSAPPSADLTRVATDAYPCLKRHDQKTGG